MEAVRSWITGVCVASILVAVAMSLVSKNSVGRVVRLVGSIIIVFAVFLPISRWDATDLARSISHYDVKPDEIATRANTENTKMKTLLIANKLSSYILERAKTLGITCEVSIGFEPGQTTPSRIMVALPPKAKEKREALSALIVKECGIKPEFSNLGSERKTG